MANYKEFKLPDGTLFGDPPLPLVSHIRDYGRGPIVCTDEKSGRFYVFDNVDIAATALHTDTVTVQSWLIRGLTILSTLTPCLNCRQLVHDGERPPAKDDDAGWDAIKTGHQTECKWLTARPSTRQEIRLAPQLDFRPV